MKLGPGLHRIGNDIVAAYLVETDAGVTASLSWTRAFRVIGENCSPSSRPWAGRWTTSAD